MKYAIWGTGKYFSQCVHYINWEDVLFLIDNNEKKWGSMISGKMVYRPAEADYEKCDYILITIVQYQEVYAQLIELGVPREKIKTYHSISELHSLTAKVVSASGMMDAFEWKVCHKGKSILICSHEFSRTGVPIALMYTCEMLKSMGYQILFTSLLGGALEEELNKREIDYITDFAFFYRNQNIAAFYQEFDMIMLGSTGTSEMAEVMADARVPVVWWLHESMDLAYQQSKLLIRDNIYYYAVSRRVIQKFKKYYKDTDIKEMPYFLPEDTCIEREENEKLTFAMIGSITRRKAQDVFVEAVSCIEKSLVGSARYIVVGAGSMSEAFGDMGTALQEKPYIEWRGEMSQREVKEFYKQVDVLVCPSRDDPMPIVVTQALQNGIPCIISDEVGQCDYIVNGKSGIVFPSEDVTALANAMMQYIRCRKVNDENSIEAKRIYRDHFSEKAMKRNLQEMLYELVEK